MTKTEIAWLSGLLEGEGCFVLKWRGKGRRGTELYPSVEIRLAMTDEDVVRRAYEMAGCGRFAPKNVKQLRKDGELCKQQFLWTVGRRDGCEELLVTLLPFMCQRRSQKIGEILQACRDNPSREEQSSGWVHGERRGYERGCRCEKCRESHNRRMREQRARRKALEVESWRTDEGGQGRL
jgi:hypothetical protein